MCLQCIDYVAEGAQPTAKWKRTWKKVAEGEYEKPEDK